MPNYDPLAILERANAHASNWQSALDHAIAQQTSANNTAFADGFARDRVFQLYPSELNRAQSGNVYQAKLADMQTRLLPDQEDAQRTAYRLNSSQNGLALQESGWAYSPENTAARQTVLDDKLQSPAAQVSAGAATYGIVDPQRRESTIRTTLTQSPGALSAQANAAAPYAATQMGQVIDRLLTGEIGAADADLQRLGLGRVTQQSDGKLVLHDAQGRGSMPMSAQEAAVVLQSHTAQPATTLQTYGAAQTQAAQAAMLKRFEQQAEIAKEDVKARNALRLELLKAAADPMATPESRTQMEQLAQRYGLDLAGQGSAAGAAPGGLPPAVAAAAGISAAAPSGRVSGASALSGYLGSGTPAAVTTRAVGSAATAAAARTPASLPDGLDTARKTSDAAVHALQTSAAQRAQRYASLKRLDLDLLVRSTGPNAATGPEMQAMQRARIRMVDEITQLDTQLREQQTRLREATQDLKRLTGEVQADNAYRSYRP
jgi:hypothetical protein